MATFLVFEIKPDVANNAISTLKSVCEGTKSLRDSDIAYVDPRGVIFKEADMHNSHSYESIVNDGKLSADIEELVKIKGPVIFVVGLTLSTREAAARDEAENIDYASLIAASITKSLYSKKDCAFLFTSNDTDFNGRFVDTITSMLPSIDSGRITHAKTFKSVGGYDEGVMHVRIAELMLYLHQVAVK